MKTLLAIGLLCGARAFAQVRLPQYSRQVLPNGAVLNVMPRKDVPLVTIKVTFKGGPKPSPQNMRAWRISRLRRSAGARRSERTSSFRTNWTGLARSSTPWPICNPSTSRRSFCQRISTPGSICCWMRSCILRFGKTR